MKPRNILLRYGDLPVALAKISLREKLITTQLLEQARCSAVGIGSGSITVSLFSFR